MRRLAALLVLFAWAAPAAAGGSNGLMAVSADGARLLVANPDSGTVSVVDLPGRKNLGEIPVGDHPEGAVWVPGRPLGLVTVYGDDAVKFLDTAERKVVFTLKVADEPYGIVTTRDGRFAYVSHDYPGTVSEIDIAGRKVTRTFAAVPAGMGCRGIALSADDTTLYVTEFFTAALVSIDRAAGTKVDRWPADAQDNLARHVELHPKRGKAYLPHTRDRVTGFDARGSVFPQLSFCDLVPAKDGVKRRRSIPLDTFNGLAVVTNPWESAVSPDGSKLYSIYSSTNDMNVCKIVDDDYEEIDRIGRVTNAGRLPRAVRTSPDGAEVYVYAALDHVVNVYSPTLTKKLASIKVCPPPHTAEWRRGKELFETALQPMGSARWISCSSCHPDGLHDGRVWHDPEGRRKTPNLFGSAHTHPLHWSADRDEVQDFEYTIRGKLMQGRGLTKHDLKPKAGFTDFAELDQTTAGLSPDLDALAVYSNSFGFRMSPHAAGPGKLTPEAERGRAVFNSAGTKCATCHSGPYYTDGRRTKPLIRHDVGTGGAADEKVGPEYDTPTLLGIYRVNSYLHDGRAATLDDVLTTHNKGDKHGKTSHLEPAERADLVAFLKSLPFEPPPAETPNTVRHLLKTIVPRP